MTNLNLPPPHPPSPADCRQLEVVRKRPSSLEIFGLAESARIQRELVVVIVIVIVLVAVAVKAVRIAVVFLVAQPPAVEAAAELGAAAVLLATSAAAARAARLARLKLGALGINLRRGVRCVRKAVGVGSSFHPSHALTCPCEGKYQKATSLAATSMTAQTTLTIIIIK